MENINTSLPEIKKSSTKKAGREKIRFNFDNINHNNDIRRSSSSETNSLLKSNLKSKKTYSCFFSPNYFNEIKDKKTKLFKTLLLHKLNLQDKSTKYFQNSLHKIFEDSNHFLESKLDNNFIVIGSNKSQYQIQYDDSTDNSNQRNRSNKNISFLSKLSGQNSSSGMNMSLYRASVSNIAIKNYIKKKSVFLFDKNNPNNFLSEAQIDRLFQSFEERIKKNKNKKNSNININYSPEVITDKKDLNHMLKIQEKIIRNKKIKNRINEKIMNKLMKKTLKEKDSLLLSKQDFYRIRKEKIENSEEPGFNYFNKTNKWLLNLRSYNSNSSNSVIEDKLIKSHSLSSLINNSEVKNINFRNENINNNTINTSTLDKNSMMSTYFNFNNSNSFRNLGHSVPVEFNNQYQLNEPRSIHNKKYDFGNLDTAYRDLTDNHKICMNGNLIFASLTPSRNIFCEKIRSQNTFNNFYKAKNIKNYNLGIGGLNVVGEKLIDREKELAKNIDGRKKLVKFKYRDEETDNKTFARSVSLINFYVPKSVKNAVDSHSL